jgi:hypothetical protein
MASIFFSRATTAFVRCRKFAKRDGAREREKRREREKKRGEKREGKDEKRVIPSNSMIFTCIYHY